MKDFWKFCASLEEGEEIIYLEIHTNFQGTK